MAKAVSADAVVGLKDLVPGKVPLPGTPSPEEYDAKVPDPEGLPACDAKLGKETDQERWDRLDSDAHMQVYLRHKVLLSSLEPFDRRHLLLS